MTAKYYSQDIAYVHHVGFGDFSRHAAPGLLATLKRSGIERGTMVDLGCGSGIWLRAAARAGYVTVGVDASAYMLRIAKSVSPSSRLIHSSLHAFKIPPCAAITAIGEVLSYIDPTQLHAHSLRPLFRRVAAALSPGGLFIFDVLAQAYEPVAYRTWFAGKDWAALVEVKQAPRAGLLTRDNTIFRKVGSAYRRSHELHRLKIYSAAEIELELQRSGFAVVAKKSYGKHPLPCRLTTFFATRSS